MQLKVEKAVVWVRSGSHLHWFVGQWEDEIKEDGQLLNWLVIKLIDQCLTAVIWYHTVQNE